MYTVFNIDSTRYEETTPKIGPRDLEVIYPKTIYAPIIAHVHVHLFTFLWPEVI